MSNDVTPTRTEVRFLTLTIEEMKRVMETNSEKMDRRLDGVFDLLGEIAKAQSDEKAKLAAGIERCNGHHEAIKELREANDNPDRKGLVAGIIAILAAIAAFIVAIGHKGGQS